MAARPVLDAVVSQHAEEAPFLWLLRDTAVWAPQYSLRSLSRLDDRIEAHIDGLRVAKDNGWRTALTELIAHREPGELFTSAVLAFESNAIARIQPLLDMSADSPPLGRALVSALGWLPLEVAVDHIERLVASNELAFRRFGIAAAAIHRHDLGGDLTEAVEDRNPSLRARAYQAASELGRVDLRSRVRQGFTDDDEGCRFAAAKASALLGDPAAVRVLGAFTAGGGPYADEACALGLRLFDEATALAAHNELAHRPELRRMAIVAAGAAGYGSLIPWILAQMHRPGLARVAGEAFTAITGVDLAAQKLEAEPPEDFDAGPTEDPADENVAMDPDEHLPWPAVAKLHDWWHEASGEFHGDTRYLLGQPISEDALWHVLQTGRQRYRIAAAIELALARPGDPLFEYARRAPGSASC